MILFGQQLPKAKGYTKILPFDCLPKLIVEKFIAFKNMSIDKIGKLIKGIIVFKIFNPPPP